jgi:hypothetical protein
MPRPARSIQAGKKAPKSANAGAPLVAHPFNVLKAKDAPMLDLVPPKG